MSKGPEIPDEEAAALTAVLVGWKAAGEKYRAIGASLGYDKLTASQTIGNVARPNASGRVGRDMAEKIYERLKTTRAEFLESRGLRHLLPAQAGNEPTVKPVNIDRVFRIAASLGRSAADALRVANELAAITGSVADDEIAARFTPARPSKEVVAPVVDDDLGGGKSERSKRPPQRKKK